MKKIIIFFFIIFVVIGCFTTGFLLFSKGKGKSTEVADNQQNSLTNVSETITTRDILTPKPPTIISDDELIAQIRNKRYLESSYMALEYSKISNEKLIEVLKNYIEDSNGMQPKEIKDIISLHEKTFLNRYLKVYILTVDKTIDPSIVSVDAEMKNALYKIKSAYANFAAYGKENPDAPKSRSRSGEDTAIYDINALKLAVQNLENANTYVDGVLKTVGIADIKIEKAWIDANISSDDLSSVLNKSEVIDTVNDLSSTPRKAYTGGNADNIIDDLEPVTPIETIDDLSSNTGEEIPFEEDLSLDLSDLN